MSDYAEDDQGQSKSEDYKRMYKEYGTGKNPHEARKVMQALVDEAKINAQEVILMRERISHCYYEHGVNHLEECQVVTKAYFDRWKQYKHGRMFPGD